MTALPEPTPHLSLYREALRVADAHGHHVSKLRGRADCADHELADFIDRVIRERPDGRCTQEAQVAIWLHRLRVTPVRFHRVWQTQASLASAWTHR